MNTNEIGREAHQINAGNGWDVMRSEMWDVERQPRVASIAYGLGTDLDAAIAAKLAKNRTRGLHHGGKAV
jgi:hypothetical protein